jgi:hypothetical protein
LIFEGGYMSDLTRVVALGELLVERQAALKEAEDRAASIKADVLKIEREDLPSLMAEVGLSTVTLTSGKSISIKEDCDARISEGNKPAAFGWLLAHGFGGLIKTVVSMTLPKGDHDTAVVIADAMRSQFPGRDVALEEAVHPQTLKAFVKERMAAGDAVPIDLFGVYAYNKAVIKN